MNGKDWHLPRSKPKLLLMKTNYYLVDFKHPNCVPTFLFVSTCVVVILNVIQSYILSGIHFLTNFYILKVSILQKINECMHS